MFRKDLVFFPNQAHFCFQLWGKGNECEICRAGVDNFVKGKGVAKSFVHHERGIVQQIVGGGYVNL